MKCVRIWSQRQVLGWLDIYLYTYFFLLFYSPLFLLLLLWFRHIFSNLEAIQIAEFLGAIVLIKPFLMYNWCFLFRFRSFIQFNNMHAMPCWPRKTFEVDSIFCNWPTFWLKDIHPPYVDYHRQVYALLEDICPCFYLSAQWSFSHHTQPFPNSSPNPRLSERNFAVNPI